MNSVWLIQIWTANRPMEDVAPFGPWLLGGVMAFPLCLGLTTWVIVSGMLLLIGQQPLWYYC